MEYSYVVNLEDIESQNWSALYEGENVVGICAIQTSTIGSTKTFTMNLTTGDSDLIVVWGKSLHGESSPVWANGWKEAFDPNRLKVEISQEGKQLKIIVK